MKKCQLGTGIGNLKWPKCSELCALSDEMSPSILFRCWAAFSDSLKLHLSALLTADTFLTKRHNTNIFLLPSLNIALWGEGKFKQNNNQLFQLAEERRKDRGFSLSDGWPVGPVSANEN